MQRSPQLRTIEQSGAAVKVFFSTDGLEGMFKKFD